MFKSLLRLPLSSLTTFSWILEKWKASPCKQKNSIATHKSFPSDPKIVFRMLLLLEFGKLFIWIQMNMVFKNCRLTMFYKIGFLKKFTEFIWKYLRSITLVKTDSNADAFLWISRNFQPPQVFYKIKLFLKISRYSQDKPVFSKVEGLHNKVEDLLQRKLANGFFWNHKHKSMQIMHVFHKLILATSNLAEGASNMAGGTKHDLQ